MKKIITIMVAVCLSLLLVGCIPIEGSNTNNAITKDDLTQSDYTYIDAVYSTMSQWDCSTYDSGENHYINKIAFYDFQNQDEVVFFKNYPIAGYCGSGYYVSENGLERISYSVYDTDIQSLHTTLLARTSYDGCEWDHYASDGEKYQMIVDAYLKYINS